MNRSRHGFTLVELLMVLAIIGVLAALLIPAIGMVIKHTKKTGTRANIKSLLIACQTYHQLMFRYPSTQDSTMFTKAGTGELTDRLSERYGGERDTKTVAATAGLPSNTGPLAAAAGWPVRSGEINNTAFEFTPGIIDWLSRVGDYHLDSRAMAQTRGTHGHRLMNDAFSQPLIYQLADPLAQAGDKRALVYASWKALVDGGKASPLGYQTTNAFPIIYSVGTEELPTSANAATAAWWDQSGNLIYAESGQ